MLVIPIAYFLLFKYMPMGGTIVAFKKYHIFKGMWASPWVGLKNFKEAFAAREFRLAIKNTLILNIGGLLINFPFPIVTAILLSEMRYKKVKKFTETVLYIPHFLSVVVIAGIMYQVFGPRGMVNGGIMALGLKAVPFMTNTISWRMIYWGSGVWSGLGYGMIIYLAAIAGVNTELYDAAYIDGAGRWKRIWHVTLPQIRPTIVTMTVMNVGKILSISFERPLLLGNVAVKSASQVISTYVYSVGLQAGRYDFAAAVGLFQSVVCVAMVLIANKVANKLGEEGIM
jgi:putative aldouronate transport system permease protein